MSQYFSQPALQRDKMLANDDPALFIIANERMKALDTPEYAKNILLVQVVMILFIGTLRKEY